MNRTPLLMTLTMVAISWVMPSNASGDICASTPPYSEIIISDYGDGFPACVSINWYGGVNESDIPPYLVFDNGCEETFHLEAVNEPGLNSVTVEPGEAGNFTADLSEYIHSTDPHFVSVHWTLGEGEANSAELNIKGYYPEHCSGCNQSTKSDPLTPLALFLFSGLFVLITYKLQQRQIHTQRSKR